MKSIKRELQKFNEAFESFNRDGKYLWRIKNEFREKYGNLNREKYGNLNREIHGTDIFPDDFRYRITKEIGDYLRDSLDWEEIETTSGFTDAAYDVQHECVDSLVDTINKDLIEWLSSHYARSYYIEEAEIEYGKNSNILKSIQLGQYYEISDIYARFVEQFADWCRE